MPRGFRTPDCVFSDPAVEERNKTVSKNTRKEKMDSRLQLAGRPDKKDCWVLCEEIGDTYRQRLRQPSAADKHPIH